MRFYHLIAIALAAIGVGAILSFTDVPLPLAPADTPAEVSTPAVSPVHLVVLIVLIGIAVISVAAGALTVHIIRIFKRGPVVVGYLGRRESKQYGNRKK